MTRPAPSVPVLALCFALAPAVSHAWTFVNVIDSSGPYSEFAPPGINAAGTSAFRAKLDGGGQAILVGDDSGGDVIATTAGDYDLFGPLVTIGEDGTVFFYAEGQIAPGWFTGPNPATDRIDPPEFGAPAVDAAGNVVALATIDNLRGIYLGSDALVDEDDGAFDFFGRPALNDTGTVAFRAQLDGGSDTGVYTVSLLGGAATPIAETDGPFSFFYDEVAIDDAGTVVFQAGLDALVGTNESGIFTGPNPATDTVVDTSGPFVLLDDPAIDEDGTVLFWGALADRGGIYSGPDPDTDRVIGSYDPLFGSTVGNVNLRSEGFENGRLAFSYTLTDGRNGVAIALAPEPGGATLATSVCMLALARVRRRVR